MKKYITIATVFTASLALCAAVWPQTGTVEETLALPQASAVSALEPTIEDITSEAGITLPAEGEKVEIPQTEPLRETIPDLKPVLEEIAESAEVQPTLEPEPEFTPAPTPVPVPQQTVTDPQPGDMVYVPGFGWLECRGIGEVIYAADIYENGNKVGSMG